MAIGGGLVVQVGSEKLPDLEKDGEARCAERAGLGVLEIDPMDAGLEGETQFVEILNAYQDLGHENLLSAEPKKREMGSGGGEKESWETESILDHPG